MAGDEVIVLKGSDYGKNKLYSLLYSRLKCEFVLITKEQEHRVQNKNKMKEKAVNRSSENAE